MSFKILFCFGTRPEAIKIAPVIKEFKGKGIQYKICVTAQHREMLDQVLEFFELSPDHDLDLMTPNQSLNLLSASVLYHFDKILEVENPNLVLVQGDTTTAFIAALAAFNRDIKVGHIEAGLRTYNKRAPFPEEVNRQLISRISDFHFVPTTQAKQHLLREGIDGSTIVMTGNTVVDALKWAEERFSGGFVDKSITALKEKLVPGKKLILMTGHRRENFGSGLEEICGALIELSQREDVQIIFPVHLNPRVKGLIQQKLEFHDNILLLEPLNYPGFLWLLQNCTLVISDSGGIQEEAPSFGKPVLVTREVSERMEGVEAGYSFLVGTSKRRIIQKATDLLEAESPFAVQENPYGDGKAASRIVDYLLAEAMKIS